MTYTGDGFLYNMVRILTGTLIEVGRGRQEAGGDEGNSGTLRQRRGGIYRRRPRGLTLLEVRY